MRTFAEAITDKLLSYRGSLQEIQIFPHVRVDGDCLGSAAAMAITLQKLDIRALVFMDEPIPERLEFLDLSSELFEIYDPAKFAEYQSAQGAVLAVDCSESGRMGKSGQLFDESNDPMVIDHHISSGNAGGLRMIDPNAAATSEMIVEIVHLLEDKSELKLMDERVANCLMAGLQSDTGRFSYQNTTPKTFRAAADLLENGANVYQNAYNLFDLTNVERMRLISRALSNARFFYNGKLALTVVTQEMIRECQASDDAADGLASNLRDIKGVIASFAIRETISGEVRVNVRSYSPFDAALFSAQFGGGGHRRAAGFSFLDRSANEVARMIIEKAGEVLSEQE